jgi:hypothetical protein
VAADVALWSSVATIERPIPRDAGAGAGRRATGATPDGDESTAMRNY